MPQISKRFFLFCYLTLAIAGSPPHAKDYFLTIGGGYNREGNQASLEANVLFFQQTLAEFHPGEIEHTIFFADGFNDSPDLQIVDERPSRTPATDFLRNLFSYRGTRQRVTYRNHRVQNIAGPIRPANIRASLQRTISKLSDGDRLFIYVTSHGGSAKGDNAFNTTISCWDKRPLSVKQFEAILAEVPQNVATIMVMAQCYCGGFAHCMFNDADFESGLSERDRVGFFAQQHDLAAAGCRPDIKNDEEFSSYFWGAIAGRTRNGEAIDSADCNGDGRVSLAEAFAYSVVASETIDIPLRTSEVLLRTHSHISGYDDRHLSNDQLPSLELEIDESSLLPLSGTIASICEDATNETAYMVRGLCSALGLPIDSDVTELVELKADLRRSSRFGGRSRGRGRRGRYSARRQLRDSIFEKWPELENRENWAESSLLGRDNQEQLLSEIHQLPDYEQFTKEVQQREEFSTRARTNELLRVKCDRLLNTLETIVLAKNLPTVADQQIVQRYHRILELENSFLYPRVEVNGQSSE